MPIRFLPMFVESLPALQGAEAMQAANIAAYGSGSLKRGDSRALWRSWERAARRNDQTPAPRQSPAEMAAVFASLGIPVEMVKVGE